VAQNLRRKRPRTLLAIYQELLDELIRRDVVRTRNAPAGDYAEWLVERATGGLRSTNRSESSWDVETRRGRKLQVKARVVTDVNDRGQRHLSAFRGVWGFDALVVVLFDGDYRVWKASHIQKAVLRTHRTYWSQHVNGTVVYADDGLLRLGTSWRRKLTAIQV
jgi:hypothetical protein